MTIIPVQTNIIKITNDISQNTAALKELDMLYEDKTLIEKFAVQLVCFWISYIDNRI